LSRFANLIRVLACTAIAVALTSSLVAASAQLTPSNVRWTTVGNVVRFQMHFVNPDPAPSPPATGSLMPQAFGAFAPNTAVSAHFDVPSIPAQSFFDVFVDIPLTSLPQNPPNIVPGGGVGGPCPPDDHWDGNVDILWAGPGFSGEVHKHEGRIKVCPGAGCSLIHIVTNCAVGPTYTIAGLCPGFHATLLNEDKVTPAPAVLPPNWTGYVCVDADAGTPIPITCCFTITFGCAGQQAIVELCATTCPCQPTGANPQPGTIDWANVPGTQDVRFHVRWVNPSTNMPTAPASGDMMSQMFGAFQPDYGPIGHFDLPAIQAGSFFDVFFDVSRASLPPDPRKVGGPASGNSPADAETGPCLPDTAWSGNVDIVWNAAGNPGQVNYHHGGINVCPGSGASYIHIAALACVPNNPLPWAISALCPGFSATLVNEDFTPAPNPVPAGWTGFIRVSAAAATPVPTTCCFTVTFQCNGVPGLIYLCATTCSCQTAPGPVPNPIDWSTLPDKATVRFHVRWSNPSGLTSAPISGEMRSMPFGVFLPSFGPIGTFQIPPLAPNSFFDVFMDVPLSSLPPNPPVSGGPGPNSPCPPIGSWHGNVDITWTGPAGVGEVTKHFADLYVCPGGAATLIHMGTLTCASPLGMPWSVTGLCPGFFATLVENDKVTPAPNPVPPGWTGYISIRAISGTPVPDTCCFKVTFLCDGVPGVIELCAITCNCGPNGPDPALGPIDWVTLPSRMVRFHLHWTNPDPNQASEPATGRMMSQMFGAFLQDFGPIGQFDVPSIPAGSFFDVFFDISLDQLPPRPQKRLVGGGPGANSPCPPDDHWDGNVDVQWNTPNGTGHVNKHVGTVLVNTSGGYSFVHVITGCTVATGTPWLLGPVCPGFTAAVLNEDLTPAPSPLPPGWTGWLRLGVAGAPPGATCCVDLMLHCGLEAATIEVCAVACDWGFADVGPQGGALDFGIRSLVPNPASRQAVVSFALPTAARAKLEIFDAAGHRVRSLVDGPLPAGIHQSIWDGRDSRGNAVKPGTYFIRLNAGPLTTSRKLVMRR
jgi:hypothetical protein